MKRRGFLKLLGLVPAAPLVIRDSLGDPAPPPFPWMRTEVQPRSAPTSVSPGDGWVRYDGEPVVCSGHVQCMFTHTYVTYHQSPWRE